MFSSERLKGIDVFVCVAQCGSFAAAAEKLNLSASAVSKGIARLEKRLGARLFQRTTRALALTEEGRVFLSTCAGVLADLEEAELALQVQRTEPQGRVRIDLPGAFGRSCVLPILLPWMQAHPLLVPHLSFSDGLIDAFREGADIVVHIGSADGWPQTIGHRVLAHEWHVLCASPAYLARHGTPLSEHDLEHHQCIAYGWADGRISPWRYTSERGPALHKLSAPQWAVGNGEGLLMAALAGCGVVQLPTWLIKQQLHHGSLVQVLPQLAIAGFEINLAWVKSRQAQPKVRVVLEALIAGLDIQD